MNRQEALEVIKRKKWAYYSSAGSSCEEAIKEYDEAIKVLGQPSSLEELLGWEVGVAYKDEDGSIFSLRAPNDLRKYRAVNGWWDYHYAKWTNDELDKLRRAEKVEHKKKYRVPFPNLFTTDGMRQYLTERYGCWFASPLDEDLKQEWTEEELYKIPSSYRGYVKEVVE